MTNPIKTMLTEAYGRLGVKDSATIEYLVQKAMEHLECDRERYVEVAEPDVTESRIGVEHGVTCRLIPIAQTIITEDEHSFTCRKTTVLALIVTEAQPQYVLICTTDRLTVDSKVYGYPVCRYVQLADITEALQVLPPQEILPAVTSLEQDAFERVFTAMTQFGQDLDLNFILRKTERAMLAVKYAELKAFTVDGQQTIGKLIPLAAELGSRGEMREDHQYSCTKELCLLVTEDACKYLLKIRHSYHYFRKVVYDDVPGGCAYVPTEEKQETTYQTVALEEVRDDLRPL